MAKAAWCSTSPSSGTNNGTVAVSGTAHTGRSSRTTTLTFEATGATTQTVTVNQASPGNVTTISTPGTIAKGGGSITVSGTSNSTKLTFRIAGTGFSVATPQISTDGGTTWTGITSNTDISGDPGAAATYQWRITVTATANDTTSARNGTLTVAPEEVTAVTGTVTQSAGDSTLSVTPTTINLVAAGTAQNVSVTSNTAWTVS